MGTSFVNKDNVDFSNGDKVPRIDLPDNDLICRLVTNDIGILVGAQLENSDGGVLLAQMFLRPIVSVHIVDIRMRMKT